MTDSPFIFKHYYFDPASGEILLDYSLGDIEFEETITISMDGIDMDQVDQEELDRALFALHLMAGVSYYKTTCSNQIQIESGSLSESQASFWNKTYTHGLGEFFYKNQIDFRGLVQFPVSKDAATPKLTKREQEPNPLVPIGGGKDSVLTAELLKRARLPFTTLTVKDAFPIKNTSEIIGKERLIVHRTLSDNLTDLNDQEGIYNGHVPITGVLSFLSVVIAILHGHTDVIFSLEQTASEGNLEYLGENINHQYSKSLEFEKAMQSYLSDNVTKNVNVFSLIRPLSEFDIVKRFSKLQQYFPVFSSCNRNFTFENTDANTQTFWCCECPKCAFMFAMLSAWLTHDQVTQIFGENLFAKTQLTGLFKELLGIEGNKPFECVGTAEETAAAFELAYRRGDANETEIMKMYESEVRDSFQNADQVIAELLKPSSEHAIPAEYQMYSAAISPLEQLAQQKILLLGFAATNRSLLKAILKLNPNADVTIADQSESIELPTNVKSQLGDNYLNNLSNFDTIIRSHGVPYNPEFTAVKDRVKGAAQLFFEQTRATSNATIIGITGTKGKSTTASLIHTMLKAVEKHSLLVGNINTQEWDLLDQITDDTVIVYELSSYMLEDFTERPDVSVWLNVYDDHLTWHNNSPDEYTKAKANITAHQLDSDICIYNANDARVAAGVQASKAMLIDFTSKQADLADAKLKGEHNHKNILAVLCVAEVLEIPETDVLPALKAFSGLPHRLEVVKTVNNVDYIDDLLATNPESTIAAIKSFNNISCLILGGEDRGYDYTELAKHVSEIKNIILLPGCRDKLKTVLTNFPGTIHEVKTVGDAVKLSSAQAKPNTTVLLSPAAPSYDQFKNYEEKAKAYKQEIEKL